MAGWLEIANEPISRDGIIQAAATAFTALAAIGAGLWGVKIGAKTTREAALQSIEADRKASREVLHADLMNQQALRVQQQRDDELAILVALAAELRLNRKLAEEPISRWYPIAMEREALDHALVLLASMRDEHREAVERAWFAIMAYNTVAAASRAVQTPNSVNELQNEGRRQAETAIAPLDEAIDAVSLEIAIRQGKFRTFKL